MANTTDTQSLRDEVLAAIIHKDGCPNDGAEAGSDEYARLEAFDATRTEANGGGDVVIARCVDCGEWAMIDKEV